MSAASHDSDALGAPAEARAFRLVSATRATVYLVGAVVLALTAHLHKTLFFDQLIVGIFTLVTAIALGLVFTRVSVGLQRSAALAHIGINAVVGILLLTPLGATAFALSTLLIVWAAATALTDFLVGWFGRGGSYARDHFVLAAFAAIFALVCLFLGNDIVALVGFCGGYLAIAGVYLGIAAASVGSTPHPRGSVQAETQP